MNNVVLIGDSEGSWLTPHPLRTVILGEVHARPSHAITVPARVLQFGFDTSGPRALADRTQLVALCEARGLTPPLPHDKHYRISLGGTILRWEQHSEFTTYTWEIPVDPAAPAFHPPAASLAAPMRLVPQPGPLLVAIDLNVVPDPENRSDLFAMFDPIGLAIAETADGNGVYATDFQPNPEGYLRVLLLDRGMSPARIGSTVQHLLDIETYRTLALLGLPEAQRLSPSISLAERRLAEVTEQMRKATTLADNNRMLDELSALAAEVEAGAASSLFRFGASRAYQEIVTQRLENLGERKTPGFPTWTSFLSRRMAPAMRTCGATEERQAALSLRLARAANLLRTRVDVELEQQNQELLKSMNQRTQLQLRLQSTVEGLSVAAITYYLTGLFSYIVKAAHEGGVIHFEPSYAIAVFVPLAALAIGITVRRIRKAHMSEELEV